MKIQGDMRSFGSPIVFLADGPEDTKIELILSPEEAYQGSGISIGFTGKDLDAEHARLTSLGCDCTPMISPNPAVRFFFFHDPNGVTIQFI